MAEVIDSGAHDVAPPLIPQGELIRLCAVNSDLFARTFFPKAMRQESPEFDKEIWESFENPAKRFVNLKIFRGGSKTTKARIFMAKRVAYGVSKTILYIGASEGHATRSIQWLRSAIEPKMGMDGVSRPRLFAQVFGLTKGAKWQENEIEIEQRVPTKEGGFEVRKIWVLGVGITGSIRGINFDDYRPDLIVADDIMNDESSLTSTQREKLINLVEGALVNSLAPEVDDPNAKFVALNTPLAPGDLSEAMEKSPLFSTVVASCWTKDTQDLPLEMQKSSWESRYPTKTLHVQKLAAIANGRYSVFAREMEVRIVAAETLSFRASWLKIRSEKLLPGGGMQCVLAVDPVPPPSPTQLASGLKTKDFEAIGVLGRKGGDYHICEYVTNRGHEPNWTIAKCFELAFRWRTMRWVVESVAAQRYLKWMLEQEMTRRGLYYFIQEAKRDVRAKFPWIVSVLSGPASQGHLFCDVSHTEFILQFEGYGLGYKGHDDVLDMVAMGLQSLINPYLEIGEDDYEPLAPVEKFPSQRACP